MPDVIILPDPYNREYVPYRPVCENTLKFVEENND